jgi:MFS-type transporter involved in bile tolerance (Atg22 family)
MLANHRERSHGSQDLYPTMLTNQYGFSANAVTVTQVVANLGAMTGGTVIGYLSQMFGRRFSIIFASIVGGALIYPYGFTGSERVIAPAFFEQAMVQGVRTNHSDHDHDLYANSVAVCQAFTPAMLSCLARTTSVCRYENSSLTEF